jgi:ribose transport system substrate-binding protein
LFTKSGRNIPALATSDGNSLSCFWEQQKKAGHPFKMVTVATGNDNVRLAVDWAVAKATGGQIPTADSFKGPIFEDSVSGKPHGVQCRPDLPGDVYLSAEMPGDAQAKLSN